MPVNPVIFKKATLIADKSALLPVIIYTHCPIEQIKEYISGEVGRIRYELPFINAVAAEMPLKSARKLASHAMIRLIDDDANVTKLRSRKVVEKITRFTGERRNSSIHAAAETAENPTSVSSRKDGAAVCVAVLDTGVSMHYDLVKPYNKIIGFKDFVNGKKEPYDDDGHGTHICGIIAGNGYSCMKKGGDRQSVVMGVAPMANIAAVKVLDQSGNGNVSDILAGLQWVLDNKDMLNIKVANISLGMPIEGGGYGSDPLARGVSSAVASGLFVAAAAGNSGPGYKTINSPGISPHAITVGAADTRDATSAGNAVIPTFSSRGPTKDGIAKPDLVAPGVAIYSLSSKSPTDYLPESGTSMATPMVSGAAALLYEKEPGLSPLEVKKVLIRSAVRINGENRYSQGAGMLNIERALRLI